MYREGGFSVSGEDVIEEINIFEGNENRLTFEQVANDTNTKAQIITKPQVTLKGLHQDIQVHLPIADVPFRQSGESALIIRTNV